MLKGGVSKSTIAVNLARQLAAHDHDFLLIGLDPNGHASVGLGFADQYHNTEETIGDVFFDDADPTSVVYDTSYEFDILPSSEDLEQLSGRSSWATCSNPLRCSNGKSSTHSLDRGEGCEIHENAYWDLQTYLGLRERLAANEGARSFVCESTRDRTPLGHAHRGHIRDLSIDQVREIYRQAITRLLNEVAETEQFFRAGIIVIDITEAEPFTGDGTGHEDEIIGTKEKTDEYAYQWATVQLVGNAVPIVLDTRPVRKGESRLEIVKDLLDSAEEMVHVDNVLMDQEFDSQHILEMISQRKLSYVVPKRMQTSKKAQAKRLLKRRKDRYETDRKLHLGKNEWHETTLIYRREEDSEHDDHRQYSVFITNGGTGHLTEYGYRWEIESGYKSIKRFMTATTSKDFGLRFFYFAFACLLYSIWRAVDLLVQVELTGKYEHSPMVTADNALTLLKKETGIG